MTDKTLTRSDIVDKITYTTGLKRSQSVDMVETTIAAIIDGLAKDESVKLSSFGAFHIISKGERIGRNPKTGKEVMIEPRRSVSFRASDTLKKRVATQ